MSRKGPYQDYEAPSLITKLSHPSHPTTIDALSPDVQSPVQKLSPHFKIPDFSPHQPPGPVCPLTPTKKEDPQPLAPPVPEDTPLIEDATLLEHIKKITYVAGDSKDITHEHLSLVINYMKNS